MSFSFLQLLSRRQILANLLRAGLTANVARSMVRPYALVFLAIKAALLDADQNALSMLNVLKIELAAVKSAEIRAQERVDRTHVAKF